MNKTADSLITKHETNCGIYLNNNLQTFVNNLHKEKVAMTAQGYVNIANLFIWLNHDCKVRVTMADIRHIVEYDLKARYKIMNGQICAVNVHSSNLPYMTFDPMTIKLGAIQGIWCMKRT